MQSSYRIGQARKWIGTLVDVARWIWCVNLVTMILGLVYAKYVLAELSGFTLLAALAVTACGRRASAYIAEEERLVTIHDARARVKASFWREQI
ncbi:MAG: hypothetical protein A2Z18_08980 [Armatimonadetes bacterium RBG_16_58_9]|nr:MAG: hypothetical protein A2Z18_08980 [Armatimonadetes bacterium RBG_16_58_9]